MKTYSTEDCLRKAEQHWKMAGYAHTDGDPIDAKRHTERAMLWEKRARDGGYVEENDNG